MAMTCLTGAYRRPVAAGPVGVARQCAARRRTWRSSPVKTCAAAAPDAGAQTGSKPKAVVVGAGWAGFGAAYALAKAGAEVVVLDAAESPGGLATAWRTAGARAVEPGIKGFWYGYNNINSLVDSLGIQNPFTEWTQSSFYSPEGLQVRSPIFQEQPRLPTPLGSFVHTAPYFTSLGVPDRLTALPLLGPLLEYSADPEAYSSYDRISIQELFRSAGVSARLYKQFLEPILLVTLFAPGEKLSAAAALDALYYFVLAHQPDFDVRWCRGSISERILQPFVAKLRSMGVTLLGGRRVLEVLPDSTGKPARVAAKASDGSTEVWEGDTLVFAVGIGAMQRIVASSPVLAQQPFFAAVNNLDTVDVMAVRLWLDGQQVRPATPSNVLAGFDDGVGATLFDLSQLQEEYRGGPHRVLELDFYHASSLLAMSDDRLVERILNHYLPVVDPAAPRARLVDQSVVRFKGAVSLFSPGCAQHMPTAQTPYGNVFMAGDWLRQGPGTHGAKGLCQEKAYVTGLQAGNLAAGSCGLRPQALVLPAEADEAHMALGKEMARQARDLARRLPRLPLPYPLGASLR